MLSTSSPPSPRHCADSSLRLLLAACPVVSEGEEEQEGYAFYLESTAFHNVEFTVDFEGSDNYTLDPGAVRVRLGMFLGLGLGFRLQPLHSGPGCC